MRPARADVVEGHRTAADGFDVGSFLPVVSREYVRVTSLQFRSQFSIARLMLNTPTILVT